MAGPGEGRATPLDRINQAIDDLPGWLAKQKDGELGAPLIDVHESIDRLEAVFAGGLRRFDKSGEYKADGALSLVAWLRWKAKLSGGRRRSGSASPASSRNCHRRSRPSPAAMSAISTWP